MYFMTLSSPGAMKQYLGHGKSSYPDLQVEFQPLPITCTTLLTATTLTILHQPVSRRVYPIINTDYPVRVKYACTCNYNQRLSMEHGNFLILVCVCVWRLSMICRILPKCLCSCNGDTYYGNAYYKNMLDSDMLKTFRIEFGPF